MDPEPTSEEQHQLAEAEVLLQRLQANPPMGGFGFELMICLFERDRRITEELLGEMMDDQVRARARFREHVDAYKTAHPGEQPNAYHTNLPVPPPEGEDPRGESPPDPKPA